MAEGDVPDVWYSWRQRGSYLLTSVSFANPTLFACWENWGCFRPFLDCYICVQAPKSQYFPHAAAMTGHCGVLVKDKRCCFVLPVMTRMISHFLVSAQNTLLKNQTTSPKNLAHPLMFPQSINLCQTAICLPLIFRYSGSLFITDWGTWWARCISSAVPYSASKVQEILSKYTLQRGHKNSKKMQTSVFLQ